MDHAQKTLSTVVCLGETVLPLSVSSKPAELTPVISGILMKIPGIPIAVSEAMDAACVREWLLPQFQEA